MVKLQFRKIRIRYKRKVYEYDRILLIFPIKSHQLLLALRGKELKIAVTKQGKAYNISIKENENE